MAKSQGFRISNDGKTYTIGGQTYSKSSFHKQFITTGFDAKIGRGLAMRADNAPKVIPAKSADEAKASADKNTARSTAKNIAKMNEGIQRRQSTPSKDSSPTVRQLKEARTTGGISGAGAKKVNPTYRMIGGGAGGVGFGQGLEQPK